MTQDTLTVTSHKATYNGGLVNILITTAETCYLDLLITHIKPTRYRNPSIQEPGFAPHRWLYKLREVRVIQNLVTTPQLIHSFDFRFPELNDTIYYTVLYHDLPTDTSPQAPIFACRVPLEPIYTTLWPTDSNPPGWTEPVTDPLIDVSYTPGRAFIRARQEPAGGVLAQLRLNLPSINFFPDPDSIFILYDTTYRPINQLPLSYYYVSVVVYGDPPFDNVIYFWYGDITTDPCTARPPHLTGFFQPHEPHLFCLDLGLYTDPDLCGEPNFLPGRPLLGSFDEQLFNADLSPTALPAEVLTRPFAIYRRTGPLQDVSNRWRYLRPLLPQTGSPALAQRP